MHYNVKDMTNKKIGKLTPIKYIGGKGGKWLCKCECGNKSEVPSFNLRRKDRPTKSCGCTRRKNFTNYKHGHTKLKGSYKSPTYSSWCKMKDRIFNPDNRMKKYYGNLTICNRWMIFENFLEDMGERPKGYEIHRIDGNKGYFPENCEWKERIKHRKEHKKDGINGNNCP